MKLLDLMKKANERYPDGFLEQYFDPFSGCPLEDGMGDTLAEFIVNELSETFEREGTDEEQIARAVGAMERAEADLHAVVLCLQHYQEKLIADGEEAAAAKEEE